ncbi:MAG: hypothetical protein WDN04_09545 [Rhodospirillales bacterium]
MPLNLASRERLQPSLLDRLTDAAPEHTRDSADQQVLSMAALRQAVLRDLAWLLNTTNLATTEDLAKTPQVAGIDAELRHPGLRRPVRARWTQPGTGSGDRHRHQDVRAAHFTG